MAEESNYDTHVNCILPGKSKITDGIMLIYPLSIIKNPFTPFESQRISGLGERIRTSGLLNPIQARYQTAPHPVAFKRKGNDSHPKVVCQPQNIRIR